MELPTKEEFVRQPVRIALGILWELVQLTAANVEDHTRRIRALEKKQPEAG